MVLTFGTRIENSVVRLMRVSKTQYIRTGIFQDAEQAFIRSVFEQIFVDFSGAPMHQTQSYRTVIQMELHRNMGWERSQISSLFFFYNGIGERNGDAAIGLFLVGFVGATTFIAVAADAIIVISGNSRNAAPADLINHLVGPNVVPHQVTQTINAVWISALHIVEKCFQGGKICVNIAE